MARRKRSASEDSDWSPIKKVKRPSHPRLPPTKASITSLATDTSPDQVGARDRLDKIDGEALGRIKKALALASHEGTGETEAKAALRMASKLMARYSVTQADILSQESEAEKLQHAGTSVVSTRSTKEGGSIKFETWTKTLSNAMGTFFDCQCYTTTFGGQKVEFCFYGLAEQTVAAAYAMEMAYNLILNWGLEKAKGVHGRNAYRTGVSHGLHKVAKEEKKQEKKQAIVREQKLLEQRKEQEKQEEQRRLDRLKNPVVMQVDDAQPKVETHDEIDLNGNSSASDGPVKVEEVEPKPESTKVKLEEMEDEDGPRLHAFGGMPFSPDLGRSVSPAEAVVDLGDDCTYGDMPATADFDDSDDESIPDLDALDARVKQENPPCSMPPPPLPVKQDDFKDEESQWGSLNQLVAFRETSVAIGEEYLKSQGIKLGKGRAIPKLEIKDSEAHNMYTQGIKDAKKIDVRGRRLKGAEQD